MTKLGELLKSEREKRNLSLHEIGMSLKINPKILKAIEDGDQANLPAKTFLRGFVKTYAQYLRLDPNEALQLFQEEYGSARPEPITPPTQPSVPQQAPQGQGVPRYESSLRRPDDAALPVANNNRIYTILITVLLVFLIGFVVKMMDKYQKESRDSKAEVAESTTTTSSTMPPGEGGPVVAAGDAYSETTTTTSLPGSSATASNSAGTASPTTTLKSNAVLPVPTTSTTTSTTLRAAVSSTTTLRAAMASTTTTVRAATPTTTTMKAALPTATTTTLTPVAPTTTTTTVKAAMTEVIIEALNRINIRFSLNGGQKWETLELNPDQVHTFRSRTAIQLEISDGGAVNVIVNGRDRGVPGTIGKPLKLNYP